MKRFIKLYVLDKVGFLVFIWSDYFNLFRFYFSTKESGGNFFYISCFSFVEEVIFVYILCIY